jgi:hypothetical protein
VKLVLSRLKSSTSSWFVALKLTALLLAPCWKLSGGQAALLTAVIVHALLHRMPVVLTGTSTEPQT